MAPLSFIVVVQSPSHALLVIPLVKTIWEHCSCLCEILEAITLFSLLLLSPTLFLGFFSLESLWSYIYSSGFPLEVNVELWFLACPGPFLGLRLTGVI